MKVHYNDVITFLMQKYIIIVRIVHYYNLYRVSNRFFDRIRYRATDDFLFPVSPA